jgi:Tol biopolymer transport system component
VACLNYIDFNDIYIQSIDPRTLILAGKPQLLSFQPAGCTASLRWSPDGHQYALVSSTLGIPAQVRIVVGSWPGDKTREFKAPIHWWVPVNTNISWQADGRALGFATLSMHTETGENLVFRLDTWTGEWKSWPIHFTVDDPNSSIEWSRDGEGVIFVHSGADKYEPGIVSQNLESGKITHLYRPKKGIEELYSLIRLSRDGRRLLFVKAVGPDPAGRRDRTYALATLDLETGAVTDVYTGPEEPTAIAWSPDQKLILFVYDQPGPSAKHVLGICPAEGGPVKRTDLALDVPGGRGFENDIFSVDWSAVDDRLAFYLWSNRADVVFIKNVIPPYRKE